MLLQVMIARWIAVATGRKGALSEEECANRPERSFSQFTFFVRSRTSCRHTASHHTTTHCTALQLTILQHTATHFTKLQHTHNTPTTHHATTTTYPTTTHPTLQQERHDS